MATQAESFKQYPSLAKLAKYGLIERVTIEKTTGLTRITATYLPFATMGQRVRWWLRDATDAVRLAAAGMKRRGL